jgi:hypothetical protein
MVLKLLFHKHRHRTSCTHCTVAMWRTEGGQSPNVCKAVAVLCKAHPSQWPRTTEQLRTLLWRRGCCAVRVRDSVDPLVFARGLLRGLDGQPRLKELVEQCKTQMLLSHPEWSSGRTTASSASEEQDLQVGARTALRLKALGAAWFELQPCLVRVRWLHSQAYRVATVPPDVLVDEMQLEGLLSIDPAGRAMYIVDEVQHYNATNS